MSDWGSADGREDLSARGVRIRATAMLRRMYSYGPREGIESQYADAIQAFICLHETFDDILLGYIKCDLPDGGEDDLLTYTARCANCDDFECPFPGLPHFTEIREGSKVEGSDKGGLDSAGEDEWKGLEGFPRGLIDHLSSVDHRERCFEQQAKEARMDIEMRKRKSERIAHSRAVRRRIQEQSAAKSDRAASTPPPPSTSVRHHRTNHDDTEGGKPLSRHTHLPISTPTDWASHDTDPVASSLRNASPSIDMSPSIARQRATFAPVAVAGPSAERAPNPDTSLPVSRPAKAHATVEPASMAQPISGTNSGSSRREQARLRRVVSAQCDVSSSEIATIMSRMVAVHFEEGVAPSRSRGFLLPRFPEVRCRGAIPDRDQALIYLDLKAETNGDGKVQWPRMKDMVHPLLESQLCAIASVWNSLDSSDGVRKGYYVADDVGCGKTLVALSVLYRDLQQGRPGHGRPKLTMIFCLRGSEASLWLAEIRKHLPTLVPFVRAVFDVKQFVSVLRERDDGQAIRVLIIGFIGSTDGPQSRWKLLDSRVMPFQDFVHCLRIDSNPFNKAIIDYCLSSKVKEAVVLSATPITEDIRQLYIPLRIIGAIDENISEQQFAASAPFCDAGSDAMQAWLRRTLARPNVYLSRSRSTFETGRFRARFTIHRCMPDSAQTHMYELIKSRMKTIFDGESKVSRQPDELIPGKSEFFDWLHIMRVANYSWTEGMRLLNSDDNPFTTEDDTVGKLRAAFNPRRPMFGSKMAEVVKKLSEMQYQDSPHKTLIVGYDEICVQSVERALEGAGYSRWGNRTTLPPPYYIAYTSDCLPSPGPTSPYVLDKSVLLSEAALPDVKVIIGTIGHLSTSLNLQFCDHVFVLDVPSSMGELDQLLGRLDRTGQQRNLTALIFLTQGTFDDALYHMIHSSQPIGRDYDRPYLTFAKVEDVFDA